MADTPHLALTLLDASQAQKHVTVNEALSDLDAIVQLSVLSRVGTAPPGSPTEGDRHIVASVATGLWTGHEGEVAQWRDAAWQFFVPVDGWRAWVEDDAEEVIWSAAAWARAGTTIGGNLAFHQGNLVPSAYVTYGGTANAITITTGLALASIPTGLEIRFRATNANTGATTINTDALGVKTAKTPTGAALPAGWIRTDRDSAARYNGTDWIVLAPAQAETGTWTPTFGDGTNLATLSTATGHYQRVGDFVTVTARIVVTSLGACSGAMRISALPFVVFNSSAASTSGEVGFSSGLALPDAQAPKLFPLQNTSYATLVYFLTTGTSALTHAHFSATSDYRISLTYKVA